MAEEGPHLLSSDDEHVGVFDDPLLEETEEYRRKPMPSRRPDLLLTVNNRRVRSLPTILPSVFDTSPRMVRSRKPLRSKSTNDVAKNSPQSCVFDGEEQDVLDGNESSEEKLTHALSRISEVVESNFDGIECSYIGAYHSPRTTSCTREESSLHCRGAWERVQPESLWFEGEIEDSGLPALVACSLDSVEIHTGLGLHLKGANSGDTEVVLDNSLDLENTLNLENSPSISSEDGPYMLEFADEQLSILEDEHDRYASEYLEVVLIDEICLEEPSNITILQVPPNSSKTAFWIGYNNTCGYID